MNRTELMERFSILDLGPYRSAGEEIIACLPTDGLREEAFMEIFLARSEEVQEGDQGGGDQGGGDLEGRLPGYEEVVRRLHAPVVTTSEEEESQEEEEESHRAIPGQGGSPLRSLSPQQVPSSCTLSPTP